MSKRDMVKWGKSSPPSPQVIRGHAMRQTARNGSRRMTSKQTNDASAKTNGVLSRAELGRRRSVAVVRGCLSAVLRIRHLMNTAADGTALSIVSGEGWTSVGRVQ